MYCFLDAFYSHNPTINMGRANPTSVSGGAQHSGSSLVGSQGTTIAPQGPLQQAPQPPPIQIPMATVSQLGRKYFFSNKKKKKRKVEEQFIFHTNKYN